jgi:hypothetical protein
MVACSTPRKGGVRAVGLLQCEGLLHLVKQGLEGCDQALKRESFGGATLSLNSSHSSPCAEKLPRPLPFLLLSTASLVGITSPGVVNRNLAHRSGSNAKKGGHGSAMRHSTPRACYRLHGQDRTSVWSAAGTPDDGKKEAILRSSSYTSAKSHP